jgi:hypothetical protein
VAAAGASWLAGLLVWPTTVEMTQFALGRLFEEFTHDELVGGLAIVDRTHIRMRRHPS